MNLTYLIRREIKLVIVSIFCFLLTVFGLSYGFLTSDNNDLSTDLSVGSATFPLILSDNTTITETDIEPGDTFTKTITVENRGNRTVNYNLIWVELLNEIELTLSATCSSSVQGNTCSGITAQTIPLHSTEVNDELIKQNISIASGETHTYVVTVKFLDLEDLEGDYGTVKNFYGKINIEEYEFVSGTLALTTDNGASGLTTGDLVTISKSGIPDQDFYVVSSDASETVLLAKYNLLVGDVLEYDESEGAYLYGDSLTSESEYGLQSSSAKAMDDTEAWVGIVPFSGAAYWYDWNNSSMASGYYPNDVYDANYSSEAPSIDYSTGKANENNYSIAYYVEQYKNTLGINGVAKLLTVEDLLSLGCDDSECSCEEAPSWLNNGSSFWTATAFDSYMGIAWVTSEGYYGSDGGNFNDVGLELASAGVRPVIVVNTADIQSN